MITVSTESSSKRIKTFFFVSKSLKVKQSFKIVECDIKLKQRVEFVITAEIHYD